MKILANLGSKKQKLNSNEYAAAVKRKDKQIEELQRANEVLRNTLMKKERETIELKRIVEKCQESL